VKKRPHPISAGTDRCRTKGCGDGRRLGKGVRLFILGVLVLTLVGGCSTLRAIFDQKPSSSGQPVQALATHGPGSLTSEDCLAKASILEQQDELSMALSYLRVAQALNPEDQAITAKIEQLQANCRQKAEKHMKFGVEQYDLKQFEQARRHFLIVLRYDPDNQKAQDYLKQRLIPCNCQTYKVQKGDTLKQVAKKFYQDPGKDFLIAYFNDLKPDKQPKPGTWLKLPHLEAEFAKPFFDIPGELTQARQFLAEERYGDVIGITGKILEYDYLNKEAEDLKSEAYYQMGLHLLRQEKYEAAMEMFSKVDGDHEGMAATLQAANAQALQRTEQMLAQREYDKALASAQLVLEYDRSNQAADDLVNRILCDQSKAFLAEQKIAEALEVLGQADPKHSCIAEASAAMQAQLKEQAESHYLQGVKYFLMEDLQKAIAEWEIAVRFDPDHVKAQQGIQNARHLLEQLDKVD